MEGVYNALVLLKWLCTLHPQNIMSFSTPHPCLRQFVKSTSPIQSSNSSIFCCNVIPPCPYCLENKAPIIKKSK